MTTASVGSFGIDFFLETARFREATATVKREAEQAAQRSKRSFDEMDSAFGRASKNIRSSAESTFLGMTNQLRALAGVAAGAFGGQAIAQQLDSYTRAGTQIRLIADTEAERVAITREVFEQAQATGVEYEAQAKLVSRLTSASDAIGASQEDVLRLARLVSQTFVISGASAQEAASSATQFAQALGSGALQGDELRSILENNLPLARAIADGFGVAVGQLKAMGAEGELTANRVLPAILNQADKINEQFEKAPGLISQGAQRLENSATVFLGKLDEALGVSKSLTSSLDDGANALIRGAEWATKYATQLGGVTAALGEIIDRFVQLTPLSTAARLYDAAFGVELAPANRGAAENILGNDASAFQVRASAARVIPPVTPKEKKEGRTVDPEVAAMRAAQKAAEEFADSVQGAAIRAEAAWEDAMRRMGEEANAAAEDIASAGESLANESMDAVNAQIEVHMNETFEAMEAMRDRATVAAEDISLVFEDSVFAYFEDGWKGMVRVFERALAEMALEAGRAAFVDILRDKFATVFAVQKSDEGGILGGVLDAIVGGAASYFGGGLSKAGATGPSGGLKGFAMGGSFVVPGPSTGDRVIPLFRANGGETVTVTPRGQAGGDPPVNITYNIDAKGADPASEQRMREELRQSEQRILAAISDKVRRRRL